MVTQKRILEFCSFYSPIIWLLDRNRSMWGYQKREELEWEHISFTNESIREVKAMRGFLAEKFEIVMQQIREENIRNFAVSSPHYLAIGLRDGIIYLQRSCGTHCKMVILWSADQLLEEMLIIIWYSAIFWIYGPAIFWIYGPVKIQVECSHIGFLKLKWQYWMWKISHFPILIIELVEVVNNSVQEVRFLEDL